MPLGGAKPTWLTFDCYGTLIQWDEGLTNAVEQILAHQELGVSSTDIVHVCASPHLDLAAARDMGFRCVWINRGSGREPLADYTPDCELATLDALPGEFSRLGWG